MVLHDCFPDGSPRFLGSGLGDPVGLGLGYLGLDHPRFGHVSLFGLHDGLVLDDHFGDLDNLILGALLLLDDSSLAHGGDGSHLNFGSFDCRVDHRLNLSSSVLIRVMRVAVPVLVALINHAQNDSRRHYHGGCSQSGAVIAAGTNATAGFLRDGGPGESAGLGGTAATAPGGAAGAGAAAALLGGDKGGGGRDSEDLTRKNQLLIDMMRLTLYINLLFYFNLN